MHTEISVTADEEADIVLSFSEFTVYVYNRPDRPNLPVSIHVEDPHREQGGPRWLLSGDVDELSRKVKLAEQIELLNLAKS